MKSEKGHLSNIATKTYSYIKVQAPEICINQKYINKMPTNISSNKSDNNIGDTSIITVPHHTTSFSKREKRPNHALIDLPQRKLNPRLKLWNQTNRRWVFCEAHTILHIFIINLQFRPYLQAGIPSNSLVVRVRSCSVLQTSHASSEVLKINFQVRSSYLSSPNAS